MIRRAVFGLILILAWAGSVWAAVSGKTYQIDWDGTAFRLAFQSGTVRVIGGGCDVTFHYTEPDPIGDIEGIPFYLSAGELVLVTSTVSGQEAADPVFRLRYVTSIPAYLWHGAIRGDDIFWGSYILQSGDDPTNPEATESSQTFQRYYKMSPPYSSYVTFKLKNTGNHESCKPFFYDGSTQLVITERGAVFFGGNNNDWQTVGDYRHYLLGVCTWYGIPVFAWNPQIPGGSNNINEGTRLWYWDGSRPRDLGFDIPDIMTFHMLESGNDLFLFGQDPAQDVGRIYRVSTDGTACAVPISGNPPGFHHAIEFHGMVYAGSGSRSGGTAGIYRLDGEIFVKVGTFSSGVNNFGTFAEYGGRLFASGVRSGGSAEILVLSGDTWSPVFGEGDFQALKSQAGTSSNLIQPSGFMVTADKLYIMLNSTEAGRSGPSYMFSIETE